MDNLSWLAGLLEGEGTFGAPPPSKPTYPFICLRMTDRDIVERAAALFGVSVGIIPPRQKGWKIQCRATLIGRRAGILMGKLWPMMGERRKAQIIHALASSHPRPQRWCSVPGCGRKHWGQGFCNKHYQRWRNENLRRETSRS